MSPPRPSSDHRSPTLPERSGGRRANRVITGTELARLAGELEELVGRFGL